MNEMIVNELNLRVSKLSKATDKVCSLIKANDSKADEYTKDLLIKEYNATSKLLAEMQEIQIQEISDYKNNSSLTKEQLDEFEQIYERSIKELNINISCIGECINITCPNVNLHRKNMSGQPYFISTLNLALIKFLKTDDFMKWKEKVNNEKMTILFTHVYKSKQKIIDNDNLDCKRIIDCLQTYGYIESDRGDRLTHIHRAKLGEKRTEITLFPTKKMSLNL